MLLSDLIRQLESSETAAADLIAAGDIALMADVTDVALEFGETLGDYVMSAVRRFAGQASSDDWLNVMAHVGRVSDPGATLILAMTKWAVKQDRAELAHRAGGTCDHRAPCSHETADHRGLEHGAEEAGADHLHAHLA